LFHVAADYRLWVPDPAPMYRTNGGDSSVSGGARRRCKRVVYEQRRHLGLVAEVQATKRRQQPQNMIGPYKRSKFQAEEVVRDLIERYGIPAVIVNP
jgi:dihydroflavonol-4-reductase